MPKVTALLANRGLSQKRRLFIVVRLCALLPLCFVQIWGLFAGICMRLTPAFSTRSHGIVARRWGRAGQWFWIRTLLC